MKLNDFIVTLTFTKKRIISVVLISIFFISAHTFAAHHGNGHTDDPAVCQGYGPQTPRDIDNKAGSNSVTFDLETKASAMNLCNIHFHNNAEHKAEAFSILGGEGDSQGYQCGISKTLSKTELSAPSSEICKGLAPGDTVEVHWVPTSCDVDPGAGLGSCLSDACANPELRVETQVFTLVNDSSALSFDDINYGGNQVNGLHQAKALPSDTGVPVVFAGSTTGPSYTEQACSALQVTWSVRPQCAKLDINTIGKWCEGNTFNEDHAHGVRKLVTDIRLLAPIQ